MDKKQIMIEAWKLVRRFEGNGQTLRQRLSRALSIVWSDVKREAAVKAATARHFAELAAIPMKNLVWELESKQGCGEYDDRWRDLRTELLRREAA